MARTYARPAPKPKLATRAKLADVELVRIFRRFARINRFRKRADARRGEIQTVILEQLGLRKVTKLQIEGMTASRVQQQPAPTYDQEALLAALTPTQARRVTAKVLDVAALEVEIAAGRILASTVEPFKLVPAAKAPYVLVSGA